MAQPAHAPTLIRKVLRHVLWPLALTWLLGTAVATGVAHHLTDEAFDRAMLDDAHAVLANVQSGQRGLELLLSQRAVSTVLFDDTEEVYFAVRRQDGSVIAGEPGLTAPAPEAGASWRFSDIEFRGKALRAIVLSEASSATFNVVIAQTTRERRALVERLLLYALLPQVLLLALLATWIWRGVRSDLRPLGAFGQALDRRDADDMAPVAVERTSREIGRLGDAVNALLQRLGHSVAAQREFTGNVAHELRTPLAGIRALAEYGLAQNEPAVWREQLVRVAQSEEDKSLLQRIIPARNEVMLTPNHRAIYQHDTEELVVTLVEKPLPLAVDDVHASAFHFHKASLAVVLEDISYTYGIEIVSQNVRINQCTFTGDLSEPDDLYTRLELICQSIGASYVIRDAKILITGNGC